jgi:GTPase KRas protein
MVETKGLKEFKIAVLGSTGVGKSSLCSQFTQDKFSDTYEPTIEDYYRKSATLDGEEIIFDIIDTAGQEGNLTNIDQLIAQSTGFVLVYDITRKQSFEEVQNFHLRVLNIKSDRHKAVVLVGNKSDKSAKREISFEDGMALARKWNCKFWEVSAKNKVNIDTAFYECARNIRSSEREVRKERCCLLM